MTRAGRARFLGGARARCAGHVLPAVLLLGLPVLVPTRPPPPSQEVVGIALSGNDTSFHPPLGPSSQPGYSDCHRLIDPAFTGRCAVASGPGGTVAGIVEVERGALSAQERDLVWRLQRRRWHLVERYTFDNPGLPTRLWSDDIERNHRPVLVFVTPVDEPGFGRELDVVDESGRVSLYRYLGFGFAVVPARGGLVAYAAGSTEAVPAGGYFDQILVGRTAGTWRVVSQQYVRYDAAMRLHRGAFYDPEAMPAR
jgi:hypothetical protein